MQEDLRINKATVLAFQDLFSSSAESKIYVFLLDKKGVQSSDIVRGTRLHPSTVRELLVRMYAQRVIVRKKLKNDHIGKNPYVYHAVSPLRLVKRYSKELEERLNRIVALDDSCDSCGQRIRISFEEVDT